MTSAPLAPQLLLHTKKLVKKEVIDQLKKILKVFLCLIISFFCLYAQPKSELEKAEAVLPILPILYYLVGGLVADKAVEMGIGFATKEIAKSKTESIAKDIVLKYEKELTQFPPTKKGAAKALWKYGGKILAEIVSALAGLAAASLLNGEENAGTDDYKRGDSMPGTGGSIPLTIKFNFDNSSSYHYYLKDLSIGSVQVKFQNDKFYYYVPIKYKGCTQDHNIYVSDRTIQDRYPNYHSTRAVLYLNELVNSNFDDSQQGFYADASIYHTYKTDTWEDSFSHMDREIETIGAFSACFNADDRANYMVNYTKITNYVQHDGVIVNKNITYNQFNLTNVPPDKMDKMDWSKIFGQAEFEKEFDLDLSAYPTIKNQFDILDIDAPIDFDLSPWINSVDYPYVESPKVGTGGLTQQQIQEIIVSVGVDVTLPPDPDPGGDGGDVDELDGSLLAYVRNAYKYATDIIDTAVGGLKSLASGAVGLTSLYKTFFGWLPKEMQVLMASGLGIMIGLRIFRK